MGIFSRLLSLIPPPEGIRLDIRGTFWELDGDTNFSALLSALDILLPPGCVLYCEGGSPTGSLLNFLRQHSIPEQVHVARGTIWPKPRAFHVPASQATLSALSDLMRERTHAELAIHFHIYRDKIVLLEWHDAFTQPMLLAGDLPQHEVRAFAERLHMACTPQNV